MQKDGARAELSPVVTWVAIAVVVVVALAVGFKMLGIGQSRTFEKEGSQPYMERVKAGGKLYDPPAAALPPGARGGGTGMPAGVPTGPSGGYNLSPPPGSR